MKLEELYSRPITRDVNPAVSATKFDKKTEETEIQEYVFTDEIINGLYRILDAIKNNKTYNHVGIWIDGYYGSGKSHFLKYLDYCITPDTQDEALERLIDAVKKIDPLERSFDIENLEQIVKWLKKATIDTCIFNLETSYDQSTDKKKAFLHVFWNEFNGKRGFNKFNITLAQNLEKPLQEKGVFEEFKKRIAEIGGNWNNPAEAADLIDIELDTVLDIAKELAPSLSIESIKERIKKRDTTMSIDRFGMELASYLKGKGEDYRLIMLADEVSQFINKERDRYLNLQEIITKLSEACENKVWVACTAQQDLSEIMDDCNIAEEKDKEGKIKGRFEVKVSLKGTHSEVITQKRILDKKEDVKQTLGSLYEKYRNAFDLQLKLPTSYKGYENKDAFIDYYPFVPYQFELIMQVFNSFLALGYVAKEVKGNERSIIKVVHSTAKANANAELGKFVSFDELYNNMFEEGLQARGQKAINNAINMARTYTHNQKLAVRVVNVLFMICNISQTDKLIFPANIDHVTSLLMNDMETPRLTVKKEVEKIIEFLCDNNVIRREQGKQGASDTYTFYSEEEMKIAQLIKSQTADNNTQANQLKEIFNKYLSLRNKETFVTRDFSVGMSIMQRSFITNNPEIVIEFAMDNDFDTPEALAMQNDPNKLVFYVGPQYRSNKKLYNAFFWYCQADQYMMTPDAKNSNPKTIEEFTKRAKDLYLFTICPEMNKILDTCPIISGTNVIDDSILGQKRGNERYSTAILKHLEGIYTKAKLVVGVEVPRNETMLKNAVLRKINPGDYDGLNCNLTPAEREVDMYLNKQFDGVTVQDIIAKFKKAPFGWHPICTVYVINELVRRHQREYRYTNLPVAMSVVASRIATETSKFTVHQAKAIPQDLIKNFIDAWKGIFGMSATPSANDSTEIANYCHSKENGLTHFIESYREIEKEINKYPFVKPIGTAIDLFTEWNNERDELKFFNAVIEKKDDAKILIDQCKEVSQFTHDQLPKYTEMMDFAEKNIYCFQYLPDSDKATKDEFLKISNDQWPIKNFRNYLKLKQQLEVSLNNLRFEIRKKIKDNYNAIFDQLEIIANDQNVPVSVLPDREKTIMRKTTPDDISTLKNNESTDDFYKEQVEKILCYKKPDIENKTKNVSLNTKTTFPISSEQDIENYLSGLRQQLKDLLSDSGSIMIIK